MIQPWRKTTSEKAQHNLDIFYSLWCLVLSIPSCLVYSVPLFNGLSMMVFFSLILIWILKSVARYLSSILRNSQVLFLQILRQAYFISPTFLYPQLHRLDYPSVPLYYPLFCTYYPFPFSASILDIFFKTIFQLITVRCPVTTFQLWWSAKWWWSQKIRKELKNSSCLVMSQSS